MEQSTHSKNIWPDRRSCWMADTMAEGRRDNFPSGCIQKLRSRRGSSKRFESFWIGATMVVYSGGLGINTWISSVFSSLLLLFVASKVSIQRPTSSQLNCLRSKIEQQYFSTASLFVFVFNSEIENWILNFELWTLKFIILIHEKCGN